MCLLAFPDARWKSNQILEIFDLTLVNNAGRKESVPTLFKYHVWQCEIASVKYGFEASIRSTI